MTVRSSWKAYLRLSLVWVSGLAKRITGSHWNGWHFFGLTPREKTRS